MAYTDPQTVTIDGSAHVLSRVLNGTKIGQFVGSDGAYSFEFAPSDTKNRLHNSIRLIGSKVTTDPLTTTNVRVGDTITLSINRPKDGYTNDEIEKQILGLIAWLTASTNANLKKFIAREN